MKQNFSEFTLKNIGIFLYFFISNFSCILLFAYIKLHNPFSYLRKFGFTLFFSLLFVFFLCFLIQKITKLKSLGGGGWKILGIYNFIAIAISLFTLLKFNTRFNSIFLDSLLNTNMAESIEFIQAYFDYKVALLAIFLICLPYLSKISLSIKISKKVNAFFLFILFAFIIFNDLRISFSSNFSRYIDIPLISFTKEVLHIKDSFLHQSKIMQDSYTKTYQAHPKTTAQENIKNIILIIGESSKRDAYQDYGQILPTTPNIHAIQNKIIYTDVITPHTTTNATMSLILNFAEIENPKNYYEKLDIISLFKLANYKTFWLSNQDHISTWGNNAANVGELADFKYFSNQSLSSEEAIGFANFDEILLPVLKNLTLETHNFITIHLLGNHARYYKRYPKNYAKFNAKDIKNSLSRKKRETIAEYLNSITYTDYILNEIYQTFSQDDTLILYLSDHGESLWDDKAKSVKGHGFVDKTIAEIPFIFFYTDTFKKLHPKLLARLEKSKNLPFMTDNLPHLLSDIANIKLEEFEPQKSLINSLYNSNRIRLFSGTTDYDKILKNH